MKSVFVTATDTGAGKTTVSGLLKRFLAERGHRVVTQKWIETGVEKFSNDADFISPYKFKLPSSPHLASRVEKRKISGNKIKNNFKTLSETFDFIIVEGIGGALVPFNKRKLVIDIARELDLPALIVAANRLGAINHTLMTIEAVKRRGMKIAGIIFNNAYGNKNSMILKDNPKIVKEITGEKVLGILPWCGDKELLYRKFKPIGKKAKWIVG